MIKAKKAFGQNFLKDEYYLDKIFQAIPDTSNIALEIGPGLGDLTEKTLIKKSVVAVEIDTDLEMKLHTRFNKEIRNGRLKLIMGDAMKDWPKLDSYELIANLPYYVATPITLKALQDFGCKSVCVLLQKEVAEKFAAQTGDSNYGAISVFAALLGDRRIVCEIPPSAFVPEPKIWSAFLRIDKFADYNENLNGLLKALFCAFSQPRKLLAKNLLSCCDKLTVSQAFEALDIKPNVRPHEVSPTDYLQLLKSTNILK